MPNEPQIMEGQLNADERAFITNTILQAPEKPRIFLEVGTWLGGGSTLHILRALQTNGTGHLWGVEACKDIYDKMIANIRNGAPDAADRFTPLFGFSTEVIPLWLASLPSGQQIDLVFLDGGDNPMEQIEEYHLLADRIKLGGVLMAHDAFTRKGKWFVPYIELLDNWEVQVLRLSEYGFVHAQKTKPQPSEASLKAAAQKLRQLQRDPVELMARYTPSWLCGAILRMIPKTLARKLVVGKN